MSVYRAEILTPSRHIDPMPDERESLSEQTHTYIHGVGLGLGLEVVADPFWGNLLKTLEPQLYADCDKVLTANNRVLDDPTASKIALLMENSPVLAAYSRVKIGPKFTPEIDVWLDPTDPSNMSLNKVGHPNLLTMIVSRIPYIGQKALNFIFFGNNIKKAYSVKLWFDKYKAAMEEIFKQMESNRFHAVCLDIKAPWSTAKDDGEFEREVAKHEAALEEFNQLFTRMESNRFHAVCLDIKSPWSTAKDVSEFVIGFLNKFHERVQFVGTFDRRQIDDLTREISGILFFHSIWDIEQAAKKEGLHENIGFNGADLLIIENDILKVNEKTLERLRQIQVQYPEINIMIYVQENNLDESASKLLIGLVNHNPGLFKFGFALGLDHSGHTARMIKGKGCGGQRFLMTESWLTTCITFWQSTIGRLCAFSVGWIHRLVINHASHSKES